MPLVDGGLDGGRLALAPGTVGGDQRLRVRHLKPLPHRAGREAAEDHVVRRADPGAGEHRHHDLGDHRQVDPDHVAPANAPRLQPVGEPLHVGEQPGVGQVALFALLAAPVERDPVAVTRLDVPVQAVVGGVEPAVGEPGVEGRVAVVEHGAERRVPVEPLPRLLRPPGRAVLGRLLVHRRVTHLGVGGEVWRRRELLGLQQLLEAFLDGWLRSRHGCILLAGCSLARRRVNGQHCWPGWPWSPAAGRETAALPSMAWP